METTLENYHCANTLARRIPTRGARGAKPRAGISPIVYKNKWRATGNMADRFKFKSQFQICDCDYAYIFIYVINSMM